MQNQFNNFFDKIYVINLSYADDRRKNIDNQCKSTGLSIEYFNAYDKSRSKDYLRSIGKNPKLYTDKPSTWWARLGCKISHVDCINSAIKKGYKRILVLEDDVKFKAGFSKSSNDYIDNIPEDWSIILFGYFIKDKTNVINQNVSVKKNETYFSITESHGAHCIAYNLENDNFKKYIDALNHSFVVFKHYDLEMHDICNELGIERLCVYPQHVSQFESVSYINDRIKNWDLEYDNSRYDLYKSGTVYDKQWMFVKSNKLINNTYYDVIDNCFLKGTERKALFNNGYFIFDDDTKTDRIIYFR